MRQIIFHAGRFGKHEILQGGPSSSPISLVALKDKATVAAKQSDSKTRASSKSSMTISLVQSLDWPTQSRNCLIIVEIFLFFLEIDAPDFQRSVQGSVKKRHDIVKIRCFVFHACLVAGFNSSSQLFLFGLWRPFCGMA
jgi:hypothetical protein